MAVDAVAWVISWGAGKIADSILKALTPADLTIRLSATIGDWAASLPLERSVVPEAVFAKTEPEPGPARQLLFERLLDSTPPTEAEWHKALLERWKAIRGSGGTLQPFFEAPEDEVSADLSRLAQRLHAVCLGDERMYRAATAGLRTRIEEWRNQGPVLLVNQLDEPARWNSRYGIRFHCHNSTQSALLVSNLTILVEDLKEVDLRRITKSGAKVEEHEFAACLSPRIGSVKLSASGPSRFSLKPDETEFFQAKIDAQLGWAYCIRLGATVTSLRDGSGAEVRTAPLWLTFQETA